MWDLFHFSLSPCVLLDSFHLHAGNETSVDLVSVDNAQIDILIVCISVSSPSRHPTFLPVFSGYLVLSRQLGTRYLENTIFDPLCEPCRRILPPLNKPSPTFAAQSLRNDHRRFTSQPNQNLEKYCRLVTNYVQSGVLSLSDVYQSLLGRKGIGASSNFADKLKY